MTPRRKNPQWLEFEHKVRMLAEAFGYAAETTSPTNDYGVDVIACRNGKTVVLQCKLYGKGRVGGEAIRQLVGSRAFHEAQEAICITTSRFTKQAREIAAKLNVLLVNQETLISLCRERNLTIPSLTSLDTSQGQPLKSGNLSRIRIGRGQDNEVVVRQPYVSRHHAQIIRDGLCLSLHDCDSANGTILNNQLIRNESQPLNYGDRIQIGPLNLAVRLRTVTGQLV